MTEPKYYTVQEFASLLGLNPQTVYRWIRAGKINAFQVHRWSALRIPASELDRIQQGNDHSRASHQENHD